MHAGPDVFGLAQLVERCVADSEQTGLLEIRLGDPPTPFEVLVQEVREHVAHGAVDFFTGREAHLGVRGVHLEWKVERIEDGDG